MFSYDSTEQKVEKPMLEGNSRSALSSFNVQRSMFNGCGALCRLVFSSRRDRYIAVAC
jgi:hypothetical protein